MLLPHITLHLRAYCERLRDHTAQQGMSACQAQLPAPSTPLWTLRSTCASSPLFTRNINPVGVLRLRQSCAFRRPPVFNTLNTNFHKSTKHDSPPQQIATITAQTIESSRCCLNAPNEPVLDTVRVSTCDRHSTTQLSRPICCTLQLQQLRMCLLLHCMHYMHARSHSQHLHPCALWLCSKDY